MPFSDLVSLRIGACLPFSLPQSATRRTVLQKVRGRAFSRCASAGREHRGSGSLSLPSRGTFHLSLTVLYAIGHWVVFSLGGWSPRLPTRFPVSRGTLDPASAARPACTGLSPSLAGCPKTVPVRLVASMQSVTPESKLSGLGSSVFARRYLRNRCFFLFLSLLRCFSSGGSRHMTMDSSHDA